MNKLFKGHISILLAAVYTFSMANESNMFEQINLKIKPNINYEGAFYY